MATYYNFDEIIDRRNTNSVKWDYLGAKYGRDDLIHLGVADMDFKSPQPILDAIQKVLDHGVFGYTGLNDEFFSSIRRWIKKQIGIDIPKEWILYCPKVNMASSITVDTLTKADAKIITNTPSYSPLKEAVTKNNRILIENPLVIENGKFTMDFNNLERIADRDTEMFILCNPDNPSTRVWSKEELKKVADFCQEHNLILFADEIHSDILADKVEFFSTLNLEDKIYDRLVYASSLTKTFNIPGIVISYMIIPNQELRNKIKKTIDRLALNSPNIFSLVALEAAYNRCDDWLVAVKDYINENERYVRNYIGEHMKELKVMPREGTYLLWIDYSALGVSEERMREWFINEANVEVYMGSVFGKEGTGYFRVNIATSRKLLKQVLDNMKKVYYKISK